MPKKSFEDITVEETHELGTWTVSEDEIIAFAEQYDPQPFHIDETTAQETIYNGLIASGWQTIALSMKTMVEKYLQNVMCMGARGIDELRWHRPVRPGDSISIRMEVLDKNLAESNPSIGDVRIKTTGTNQDGHEAVSWINNFLVQRNESEQ